MLDTERILAMRFAGLSLFFLPIAVGAAAAAVAEPPTASTWQVDWGQYYCSLIRQPGEDRRFATAMMAVPGAEDTTLMLIPSGGGAPPARITSLLLLPQRTSFEVSRILQDRGGRQVAIYRVPYEFRTALAGATELQLRNGDEIRFRIPLPNAAAAVAAHRQCTAEIARQWGVDEAALAALSQRPATTNLFGFSPNDYPAAAIRQASEGRVLVRIALSAEGRATECATVATSGSPVIDATTCNVILSRARFRPGLDSAGRPVAARYISSVAWLLPD